MSRRVLLIRFGIAAVFLVAAGVVWLWPRLVPGPAAPRQERPAPPSPAQPAQVRGAFGYALGETYDAPEAEDPVRLPFTGPGVVYEVAAPRERLPVTGLAYQLLLTPDSRRIYMLNAQGFYEAAPACLDALAVLQERLQGRYGSGETRTGGVALQEWYYAGPDGTRHVLLDCTEGPGAENPQVQLSLSYTDLPLLEQARAEGGQD